jgi:pyruvate/2-oxoglutarate dehydrogenase complex dihydrolipoamide acyltransferase (E2) component
VNSSPTDQNQAASSASRPGAAEAVEVTMPQMGVSVAEGTITEWVKRPGDWVEADEIVCIVTTDKVDVEIPAPASGRLQRVLVEVDQTVAVGTSLAEIDPAAKPGQAHPEEESGETHKAPEPAAAEERPAPERPAAADGRSEEPERSGFYSPVVRRIADKHGIDLSRVAGTGIGGRVRKRDVLAYIESGEAERAAEPAAAEAAEPAEMAEERPLHIESPYRAEEPAPAAAGNGVREAAPAPAGDGAPTAPERREPMSPMRKRIAEHMLESRRTAAHCTTIVEVDMSAVAARRRELKEAMARRGVPLTYLAFVARATVEALHRHPILNARLDGDQIVYQEEINLGIAVALEQGLIVPVIRRAERLSLEGLAASIAEVAERARAGRLDPDDVHGGTFTITNPGQFGAVLATPIINQPQVAILDLEAIVKRPVVVERDGEDAIASRPMTYLCMSWDHRALDGAVAARFLAGIKDSLERWGDSE